MEIEIVEQEIFGGGDDGAQHDWEGSYKRSWDTIQEKNGELVDTSAVTDIFPRPWVTKEGTTAVVQRKGLIRFVILLLDFSGASATADMKVTRQKLIATAAEQFIHNFFVENPLSLLGVYVLKDKQATLVAPLGGSPVHTIHQLKQAAELPGSGHISLRNGVAAATAALSHQPPYGSREILTMWCSLSTTDPTDATLNQIGATAKEAGVAISTVSLTAEMYAIKRLATETGGKYSVAVDAQDFTKRVEEHLSPPSTAKPQPQMVKMGYPKCQIQKVISFCDGMHVNPRHRSFTCPNCLTKNSEVPTRCKSCSLPLVSSPLLAQTFHHLIPLEPFIVHTDKKQRRCMSCCLDFYEGGSKCPKCKHDFCYECDMLQHTSLHHCVGCELPA